MPSGSRASKSLRSRTSQNANANMPRSEPTAWRPCRLSARSITAVSPLDWNVCPAAASRSRSAIGLADASDDPRDATHGSAARLPADFLDGPFLAHQQGASLVSAQKAPERGVLVPRLALRGAFYVSPKHGQAAQNIGFFADPVDRGSGHEQEAGAHEIVSKSLAHAAREDALLAGTHAAQMDEPQLGLVPAACDPALHAAAMTIDPVPHHLPDETADLLEAGNPIELRHAEGGLVTVALSDQRPLLLEVSLPAARTESGVGHHPLHQDFEIPRRKAQVEIQLAKVVVVVRVDRVVPGVERLYDARADGAAPAIASGHDLDPFVLPRVRGQYLWRLVRGAIVDNDPFRGTNRLRQHGLQRLPHELCFVAARGDQHIAAGIFHSRNPHSRCMTICPKIACRSSDSCISSTFTQTTCWAMSLSLPPR